MATMANQPQGAMPVNTDQDPFVNTPPHAHPQPPLRFAPFDHDKFSIQASSSPGQARRALEAHMKETDRRIQDASRLGTSLLQQRKDLAARLKDLEQQKDQNEVTPELQKKLAELEREYTEVGRETARAFLPKARVASESNDPTMSPAVFSGDSRASPTKVAAPSRRQRNQPSSRVHDIEFATEISTSLLAQVRQLQAVLVEKDDALRETTAEKSRLEIEYANLRNRLRHLDENEQKYKDENWNLETQLQELTAAHRDTTDREQRLNTSLKSAHAEKEASLRELEDLKQAHGKLSDDHANAKRQQESDLHYLRRDIAGHEHERDQLHKKIDELTSQNTELARAVALRWNDGNQQSDREVLSGDDELATDRDTLDYSPPPSPSKNGARQGVLETETLKSSLQHAHRMIQNLKNNIHREKSEKIELKRMLQDARDEIESRRGDGAAVNKKRRSEQETHKSKRKPDQLGAARMSREEVIMDDPDWENYNGDDTLRRSTASADTATQSMPGAFTPSEESTDAFETANERETESEAFQTGNEGLSDESSGQVTETEGGAGKRNTTTQRISSLAGRRAGNRSSFRSTASTSADEADDFQTPAQAQHPKYKLRMARRRGGRFSELMDEAGLLNGSPASQTSTNRSTPVANGKSLGDELDALSDDETADGTPSRASVERDIYTPPASRSVSSPLATSSVQKARAPRAQMVDSSMMTEPWEPAAKENKSYMAAAAGAVGGLFTGIAGAAVERHVEEDGKEREATPGQVAAPGASLSGVTSQHTEPISPPRSAPSMHSGIVSQHTEPASPPRAAPWTPSNIISQHTEPASPPRTAPWSPSSIIAQYTEPVSPPRGAAATASPTLAQHTEPASPPRAAVPATSAIIAQSTEPIEPARPRSVSRPAMALSSILSQHVEPSDMDAQIFPPRRSSRRVDLNSAAAAAGAGVGAGILVDETSRPSTARRVGAGDQTDGVPAMPVFNDEIANENAPTAKSQDSGPQGRLPFGTVSSNAQRAGPGPRQDVKPTPFRAPMVEQATQTLVSSKELDNLLEQQRLAQVGQVEQKGKAPFFAAGAGAIAGAAFGATAAGSPQKATANTSSPRRSSEPQIRADAITPQARPGSAGSTRRPSATPAPPLPVDHNQKIAAAAKRAPPPAPTLAAPPPGSMGPPMMPASAYRTSQPSPSLRPRTPSVSHQRTPSLRGSNTPRPIAGTLRSEMGSPISRRSSVSSFASEIDQRLNPAGAFMYPSDVAPATDPRMIQAITQTMIGEYLWKYTRKAGRSDISSTRHRRFFWVHPYTRTLYWSETDPSTAGKQQLKAKSVAIEAVRVMTDDNVSPPGLHRKSLVVVTPGREIVFTAPTAQRHETWFNALSYLLLRTAPERDESNATAAAAAAGAGADTTAEDFDPANPGPRSSSRATNATTPGVRPSMSSYNSRVTTRTSSPQRSRTPGLVEQPTLARAPSTPNRDSASSSMAGRLSSLSGLLRGRGSVSSRYSTVTAAQTGTARRSGSAVRGQMHSGRTTPVDPAAIYDASVMGESSEDLRAVIERQEREAGRLENVRACCDGKHDVGSLSASSSRGRHNHNHTHSSNSATGSLASRHAHPRTTQPASTSSRPRRGE